MPRVGEHLLLSVAEVQYDKNNPRIKRFLAMYGENPTPEQIHLALGSGGDDSQSGETGTTFHSLKESIRTSGGIIHPVIVNKEQDGKLIVVEGNTRVAIYRQFREDGVDGNWDMIPSLLYENLPQDDIDAIRLQSHLVGPRAWDPYSKAKYLNHLHSHQDMPFERLVDLCGGRRKEVEEYIAAYLDMEKYYRPLLDADGDFDAKRFSGFVELQRGNVKEVVNATHSLEDFGKWIHDRLIDPLNTVRALPRILRNEQSSKIFLSEGAREALKVLESPSVDASLNDATLEQLCTAISHKLRTLTWDVVRRFRRAPDSNATQAIFELKDDLSVLVNDIQGDED